VFNRKRLRLLVRHFHENGLKLLLENPGNVRDFLQMLEVQLLARIDFAQMGVVPGRLVQRDYRHLESDLVLQAPVRPRSGDKHRQILLYILIEHQSEPDRLMPLRVLEYVVAVYKRQMRDWKREHGNLDHFRFQPVLPIVLYTGSFGRLLRLILQRRTRLKVFEETLHEVVRALESLAEGDRERWSELLSYIDAMLYYEREPEEYRPLQQTVVVAVQNDVHRQEVYNMAKNMAEQLKEEGLAIGLHRGEVRTQRRLLVRLLRNRFGKVPPKLVKRIEATQRLDLLDAWFHEASAIKKLDDLSFAGD
jgi:hypothetical protein